MTNIDAVSHTIRQQEVLGHLRTAIEHAPLDPGKMATNLKGWTSAGLYLCARCAGRIMARGCRVPDCLPVWQGSNAPSDVCCLCGK